MTWDVRKKKGDRKVSSTKLQLLGPNQAPAKNLKV